MGRVLGIIRLSVLTEATTSPERQRELIEQWASVQGHRIVGWAEDLGVSASVEPFQRPGLGPWLRGERESFDVLACWRVDRVARRVLHFAKLLEWAEGSRVSIVSVSEGFDLGTPFGRVVAQIIAALAEGEYAAIKERSRASYTKLERLGRFPGGVVPFGYRPVPIPGGGVALEIDPDAAEIVRDMVRRVLEGESLAWIARELNERQIPTATDLQRIRRGKKPRGTQWKVITVSHVLRSWTLMGYVGSKEVIGEDGLRVRRAEPILTDREWAELQAEMDRRRNRSRPRRDASLLRRVIVCGVCGKPCYRFRSKPSYVYYRCASRVEVETCGNRSVRQDVAEGIVTEEFLKRFGDVRPMLEERIPGEDHSAEIKRVEEALDRLSERLELVPPGAALDAVLARMADHQKTLDRLRSLPTRAEEIREVPAPYLFREVWSGADTQTRNGFLRSVGTRAYALDGTVTVEFGQGDPSGDH